jgi:hypothetical protein
MRTEDVTGVALTLVILYKIQAAAVLVTPRGPNQTDRGRINNGFSG